MQQQTEAAVLSIALNAKDLTSHVLDALTSEHFADNNHRAVFQSLRRVGPDAALIADDLGDKVPPPFVAALGFNQVDSSNLDTYLSELNKRKRDREYLEMLRSFVREFEQSEDRDETLARQEAEFLNLQRTQGNFQETLQPERINQAFEYLKRAYESGSSLMGIDTGFSPLNDLTNGWFGGGYTVIIGAPGAGKTAIWQQSALHVAESHSPVAMVQLEMSETLVTLRQLAAQASVGIDRLQNGQLNDRDFQRLTDKAAHLSNLKHEFSILDSRFEAWPDIARWFRRKHSEGAQTLWIDNMKLVQGLKGQSDLERFQYVSRQCRRLARELNIHVIAIHHVTKVPSNRPIEVNDAYGSSAFRQDADTVIVMNVDEAKSQVVLETGKARNGVQGLKRFVHFNGPMQRFEKATQQPRVPDEVIDREGF